ncbi:hypothetical protein C8J56DRAFT_889693 [Mycena floridula]|nr:hypothetical protein C8J56DRAFT_889693 [Mycena floridula]
MFPCNLSHKTWKHPHEWIHFLIERIFEREVLTVDETLDIFLHDDTLIAAILVLHRCIAPVLDDPLQVTGYVEFTKGKCAIDIDRQMIQIGICQDSAFTEFSESLPVAVPRFDKIIIAELQRPLRTDNFDANLMARGVLLMESTCDTKSPLPNAIQKEFVAAGVTVPYNGYRSGFHGALTGGPEVKWKRDGKLRPSTRYTGNKEFKNSFSSLYNYPLTGWLANNPENTASLPNVVGDETASRYRGINLGSKSIEAAPPAFLPEGACLTQTV